MATYFWVGGTGTWSATGNTQFAITSGGVATLLDPTAADVVTFDANSGTGTITLGETVSVLQMVMPNYAGTLDFQANEINLTFAAAAGTVFTGGTANTILGTPKINLTGASAVGSSRTINPASPTESNTISFNISAGAGAITFTTSTRVRSLTFTSGFTGSFTNRSVAVFGNLTIGANMTVDAGTNPFTFSATLGIQQITTNGKTLDQPLVQNSLGATVQLQDNLTISSTRAYTLTNGTLDLSSGNRTLSTGLFSSSNSNARSIAFGTGSITTTGSGTVWNTATVTNFSRTGTPTVNISNNSATATTVSTGAMTEAQSLNFNYTIGTYTITDTAARYKSVNFTGFSGTIPNSVRTIFGSLTLSTGMTLTAGTNATTFASTSAGNTIINAGKMQDYPIIFDGIGGTFAFQDALTQGSTRAFTITNGTVQLKNGVTSTVGAFATSGTNQKFLESTLAGSQATLSKASGTVNTSYLTIKDINAVGGATWNAFTNQLNIDAGNNDGWDFGISPVVGGAEYTYALRSFTQPRRF